jgi:trehalose 6-phosphate phosphatase
MQRAVEQSPGLTLLRGKMVVEAKPGGASKGAAIEAFMAEPPFAGRTPVFVGDDITDEVGFATVQRLRGLGVKVGEGASVAWQRIATPAEFRQQLQSAVAAKAGKVHA